MLWVLGGDLMRVQCDHRGCELELDLQDASVHYVTLWLRCTMSHGERADAQARWFEKRERERESERMEGADLAVVQGGMVAAAAGTR